MEFLSIISIGLSIYALVKIHGMESKLSNRQEDVAPQSSVIKKVPTPAIQSATISTKQMTSETGSLHKLWLWYSHDWPLKTGALFILMGFIWLVTYAFLNNWIGPVGRITFGLIVGSLILYGGELRLRKIASQGITLVGLGAAVMVVSIASAQFIYHMFPSIVALGLLTLTMVLTGAISLRHKQISLAIASLIIAGLAPILIGSTDRNILGLYSYLLVVSVSFMWLARFSKWRILTLLSLIIVALYSVSYFFTRPSMLSTTLTPIEIMQLQFFAITFISIYFMSNLATIVTNQKASMIDLQTAVAVGLFTLAWINGLVTKEYQSLVSVAAAVAYAAASYGVYIKTQLKTPVFVYTAVATILLAIATGQAFDGPTLVIAFSIEALILPIVATSLLGAEMGAYLFLYFVLPFLFSIEAITSYSWVSNPTIFHDAFYSLTVVMLSFLLSGVYFYRRYKSRTDMVHTVAVSLVVIGALYGLIWIWKVFHVLLTPSYVARMVIIILYAMLGMGAYLIGQSQSRKIVYRFGIGLLIFVVARLLIIEVWDMELIMRIVTFFAIGLLFIGSVLLRKSKEKTS